MLMLFASLLAIPLALNILASQDDFRAHVDGIIASAGLCLIWGFMTVCAHVLPFPDSKKFHSLIDLIALALCVAAFMTQFHWWKVGLAALFAIQLWAHFWFWREWNAAQPPDVSIGRTYVGVLNVLWFGQLLCVGAAGGSHVANATLARLRAGWQRPHMAGR